MLCGILISGKWSVKEKTLIGTHTDMINFLHVIPRSQSSFTFLVFYLRSRSTSAHLGCKMSWERENWGRRISSLWMVGYITAYNVKYLRKKSLPTSLHEKLQRCRHRDCTSWEAEQLQCFVSRPGLQCFLDQGTQNVWFLLLSTAHCSLNSQIFS